jgi:hypothetical protein
MGMRFVSHGSVGVEERLPQMGVSYQLDLERLALHALTDYRRPRELPPPVLCTYASAPFAGTSGADGLCQLVVAVFQERLPTTINEG